MGEKTGQLDRRPSVLEEQMQNMRLEQNSMRKTEFRTLGGVSTRERHMQGFIRRLVSQAWMLSAFY